MWMRPFPFRPTRTESWRAHCMQKIPPTIRIQIINQSCSVSKTCAPLLAFRAIEEIQAAFERFASLRELCGGAEIAGLSGQDLLRAAYARLMKAEPESAARAAAAVRSAAGSRPEDKCFLDLTSRYGDRDPGIFAPYFQPPGIRTGQGIFLGPNEPHSDPAAEILECMASSDNVVRAGLTPKFCDVDTLLSMLTYRTGRHEIVHLTPEANPFYEVPVSDFALRLVPRRNVQGPARNCAWTFR